MGNKFPNLSDITLAAEMGNPIPGQNSWIDLHLMATLERDVVDVLVTEDRGIHRCCKRLSLGDRCLTIGQALAKLQDDLPVESSPPPAVRSLLAHELDESDPIFSSFHQDYPTFPSWLAKCRSQHRQCWIVSLPGRTSYAGVCIVNREDRCWTDAEDPTLKICTFKIADDVLGMKLGELLLRTVFDFAHSNSFRSLFVETFPKQAVLVHLLQCFGFHRTSEKPNGEMELRKRMMPFGDTENMSPLEFHQQFGPYHVKLKDSNIFVVPIEPRFHCMLFPDLQKQLTFFPGTESFGNTMRKAYICNAGTRKVAPGNVLLFYRSHDQCRINALGVVEETLRTTDSRELARCTGKRTVFEFQDIEAKTQEREALAIIFRYAPVLRHSSLLNLKELMNAGILKAAPQSIQKLKQESISWVEALLK